MRRVKSGSVTFLVAGVVLGVACGSAFGQSFTITGAGAGATATSSAAAFNPIDPPNTQADNGNPSSGILAVDSASSTASVPGILSSGNSAATATTMFPAGVSTGAPEATASGIAMGLTDATQFGFGARGTSRGVSNSFADVTVPPGFQIFAAVYAAGIDGGTAGLPGEFASIRTVNVNANAGTVAANFNNQTGTTNYTTPTTGAGQLVGGAPNLLLIDTFVDDPQASDLAAAVNVFANATNLTDFEPGGADASAAAAAAAAAGAWLFALPIAPPASAQAAAGGTGPALSMAGSQAINYTTVATGLITDPHHPALLDYNYDMWIDDKDIDLLSAVVRDGVYRARFDAARDTVMVGSTFEVAIDSADRDFLGREVLGTEYGDADLDGDVDNDDLNIFFANAGVGSTWAEGDFNGNGDVEMFDYYILLANLGFQASSIAVPEPSSVLLAIVCVASCALPFRGPGGQSRETANR